MKIESSPDICVLFIWSALQEDIKKTEGLFPYIISNKIVELNENGMHNLFFQLEYDSFEKWIKKAGKVRVITFQADKLNKAIEIQNKIDALPNASEKFALIVSTKKSVIKIIRLIFNDNGLHFLNYASPSRYVSIYRKIAKYKNFISKNKINRKDILLDSGMVLELYGLRRSSDIDYFVDDNAKVKWHDGEFDAHDDELEYHNESKLELINNPKYYFYFNEIKFISFNQVYRMKRSRRDIKDINDCQMMEALIEGDQIKYAIGKVKQNFYYVTVKISRVLKLYGIIRLLYRKVKK